MSESKADSDTSKKKATVGIVIWVILVLIVLVWGSYWEWVAPRINGGNQFDPLNALFSGLAFWGVIYAILLQKSELVLQREELGLTRGEVRGQKEQLEVQNRTLKQQRFENTFFSLLNLFSSIVNSIEIKRSRMIGDTPDTIASGRECFSKFTSDFRTHYSAQQREHADWGHRTLCATAYDHFFNSRQGFVGHYFRTLYNIVKFIMTSEVENKQMYVNILRAQLSSSELTLLFYNCISKYGSEKFKLMVEQFGLLENMDFSGLIDPKHRELFNESAFHSQS
jgi:Putative phage abortive infection protein